MGHEASTPLVVAPVVPLREPHPVPGRDRRGPRVVWWSPMTAEQARAQFDRHRHAGDHRCTAPGCTGRWPCWYRLDAIHTLSGGQR